MPAHRDTTLILTSDDVAEIVRRVGCHGFMDQLIDRLQEAFAEFDSSRISVPVRDGFHYDSPVTGLVEWMPIHHHGQTVLMKLVGYHPNNPLTNVIPTVLSTLSLFDARTGSLNTVADGTLLTAMRTGAASAVATRLLSDSDSSSSLGLIGCGAQAVTQVHAISRVRELRVIRFFDTNSVVMNSFADRVRPLLPHCVKLIPSSLQELVERSDVLCTATSVGIGEGPVFEHSRTQKGVHINAVGSDLPGKTELPMQLLSDAFVSPDFPAQAIIEGECQQLSLAQIGNSILEIAAAPSEYVALRSAPTVFDSTGWALEDFVALQLAIECAESMGIGSRIPIEPQQISPWNPYESLKLAEQMPSELPAIGMTES